MLLYLPQSRILGCRISLHLCHDPLSLVTKQFLLSVQPSYLAGTRARLLAAGTRYSFQTRLDLLKIFLKYFPLLTLSQLLLTCIELQVVGRPPMRCLRSGGRMLSRILFSCSRAAEEGPRLLTTLEAEMTMDDFTEYSVYSAVSILFTVLYCCTGVN